MLCAWRWVCKQTPMNEQSTVKAALWMAGSIACFLTMSVAGRTVTAALDVFQVMEMRSIIGLVMLSPLIYRAGGLKAMRTRRPALHVYRNVLHYAGQFGWLIAVGMIPLAEMVAIEFTTPIWTAVWAVLFLREALNRNKLLAMAFGLIGVLMIVRPGGDAVQTGHLIMVAAAMAFGITITITRSLAQTESTVRIIFWMLVIQSAIGLAPAIYVWQPPELAIWPPLLVVAFTGTFSHFCMARALSYAEATVVSPMDFMRLPLTALIGWFIYSEQLDAISVAGAVLILSGNVFNLRRRSTAPTSVTG